MKAFLTLHRVVGASLLSLLYLLLATAAYADSSKTKVGAIAILSGESSQIGMQAQRGAQIAIDEINAQGGVNGRLLHFIWEDETGGKAARAVSAYKKLTTIDRVDYIFGPCFQDGLLALAPMAKRDNFLLVTGATPSLSLPNVFSTWLDPKAESEIIAKHIVQKYKRVSVLAAQQTWELMVADQFKKSFTESGGVVASYSEPLMETKDVKSEVLLVKQSQSDAVFISSYTLFAVYVKELRRIGVTAPIFGIELDHSTVQAAGPAAEGVISIGPAAPESAFTKSYRRRYGSPPDIPSHQSYDAVNLLAEAIRANGMGTENVLRYFREFKSYEGASGTLTNTDGVITTTTAFFIVRNGKLERM